MQTKTHNTQIEIVSAFYGALEDHDENAMSDLLKNDIIFDIPLSPTGDPKPWQSFKGKEEAMGYLKGAMKMFSRLVFLDKDVIISQDKIMVSSHGDLIKAEGSVPYHNVYVHVFKLDGFLFKHIQEFANPVPISKLLNTYLG